MQHLWQAQLDLSQATLLLASFRIQS